MNEILVKGLTQRIPSSPNAKDVAALESDMQWLARSLEPQRARKKEASE